MLARSARLALVLFALVPVVGARAATTWTAVPSGTTAQINAIATVGSEVVLVDGNGGIRHLVGGSFVASTVSPAAALGFTDVAMSPDGTKGVAVGPSGTIYRSTDSGATWSKVADPAEPAGNCPNPGPTTPTLADDLSSVQFADANTVYITGAHDDVLKSVNGGTSFLEQNKSAASGGSCKITPSEPFGDTQWIDANTGYLMSTYFGDIYKTADGLGSAIADKTGEGENAFGTPSALAMDPSNHQRLWEVESNTHCGSLCLQNSTNGGVTWVSSTFDGTEVALRDVSIAGGTVIAVGDGGDIYTSPDGQNFFRQVSASFPTNNWFAVSVANATTAYVGGAGGVLLVSTTANQVPDTTAPTGTISGPTTLTQSQFGTYTANVSDNPGGSGIDPTSFVWSTAGLPDQTGHPTASFAFSTGGPHTITVAFKDLAGNPGTASINVNVVAPVLPPASGSRPVSTTTGGATITTFKQVTVSHRKGRFIPVILSAKHPRTFVITLVTLSKKHPRSLAKLTVTLKKGKRTVHLGISNKVKLGSYRLVVRVLTTGKHSHQIGRSVKQVFVLV